MGQDRQPKRRGPLDEAALERIALRYAERYATTRAKLATYLVRKLRERGWAGAGEPPVERLVGRMAELGYVDDRAFALAKGASLRRRGYGARRLTAALRAAGVAEEDGSDAHEAARIDAWASALRFAEKRRIGPFADESAGREAREKALAKMLRAGHPLDLARILVAARPGSVPEADDH